MTPEQAVKLRAPFPAHQVGKLPKGGGVELDYIGHGAVTDRLLEVDPEWNWEPLSFDDNGQPTFVYDPDLNPIAFWVRLTVCGLTRLGVGTCTAKQFDAEKVLIGDAIRNAAMRFGVALDLWIRGHAEDDEKFTANDTRQGPSRQKTEAAATKTQRQRIATLRDKLSDVGLADLLAWVRQEQLPDPEHLTKKQAEKVLEWFKEREVSPGGDSDHGDGVELDEPPGDTTEQQELVP